jgi:formylglycine-generating enzyme required for sulfatase activity
LSRGLPLGAAGALALAIVVGAGAGPPPGGTVVEPLPGLRLRWVAASPGAPRGFHLAETEVDQALWRSVMGGNPSVIVGDDLPVEWVTWEGADEFARRLAARTGQPFRLPSEAEWEAACRASDGPVEVAPAAHRHQRPMRPVAEATPGPGGWRGMHDNVWEWCADALGPDGTRRVLKGGTCNRHPGWCAVDDRTEYPAGFTHERRGVRLAMD